MISSSKILFYFCISFIFGIFIESLWDIPQIFLWVFLFMIFLFMMVFVLLRKKYLTIICFCAIFIIIGILWLQISEFNIYNNKVSKFNDKNEVDFTGIIYDEPDVREDYQRIKVKVLDSVILITTKKYPEYKYLDKIKILGRLETPAVNDDFNYKNYLLKDHIYSVMYFPKIETISKNHDHNIYSYIYENILFLKNKIRTVIKYNFLPPQSSIIEGTILGDNGAMSQDLKDKLNITGLRHIIAVSGTHIVILSSIIMTLLIAIGFWRRHAFYIVITFIIFYIVFTGLPPSGIRAGIMGGIYLLSQNIGRQVMTQRLIAIACAIMLLINPLLLFYDIGFQLSFLAVLGLIYFEPFIRNFIKKFTKDRAKNLISIISTTFAAQVLTLPIMIYNFGNISFVSPITNILVLPIIYWLMVFGFLSSIVGMFSITLGWILSIPCWILTTYFIKIIEIFSKPWMAKSINNISWIWLFVLYFIISLAAYSINKKYLKEFL